MQMIMSTSVSELTISLACCDEFAQMNLGGLLRFSSRYSLLT